MPYRRPSLVGLAVCLVAALTLSGCTRAIVKSPATKPRSVSTRSVDLPDIGPGKILWSFTDTETPEGGVSAITLGADTIYVGVGVHDSRLYALRPDGTRKWAFRVKASVTNPIMGSDGTIYLSGSG
ncbi:MAG: hypothetical protein ACYC1U_04875 [Candidatus Aquicultorales bacterium]